MISVLIYIESRFPADRVKIRSFVETYLADKIKNDVEVGINIIGDRKMKMLNLKFRNLNETTDVLSFPIDDASASTRKDIMVGFSPEKSSPDQILRLGDVVISFPQTILEAAYDNQLVDQRIEELITHGLDHLMGKHHD